MKRFFTLLLLVAMGYCSYSQDSTYARKVICTLADEDYYGRGMQKRGDSIAASYIRQELQANGIKPLCDRYFQYFHFPRTTTTPPIVRAGYRSQNVCGYIPGETDTMIVFTAHYDHLGMNKDTIFYGAHDNASGVAAVLDIARQYNMRRGHYTMVFLFFGGEEAGLVGSEHFVDAQLINLYKVKLLINIDLFCGGRDGIMIVNANDERTDPFVSQIERINDERDLVPAVKRRNNAQNSDHYYFTEKCPAIFLYTLGGRYGGYHSPKDTCEGCGLENYNNMMMLLRIFLEQLEENL